jgi:hypothetical protein
MGREYFTRQKIISVWNPSRRLGVPNASPKRKRFDSGRGA